MFHKALKYYKQVSTGSETNNQEIFWYGSGQDPMLASGNGYPVKPFTGLSVPELEYQVALEKLSSGKGQFATDLAANQTGD